MSTYKVPVEKGFQILASTYTNLIFINGISFSQSDEFASRFNSLGFNVLKLSNIYNRLATRFSPKITKEESITYIQEHFELMDGESELGEFPQEIENDLVDELHKYFDRFRKVPCVVAGNIGSMKIINKIFNETYAIYTYVYVYPNDSNVYQRRVMDAITNASKIDKKDYLSSFESLVYEYQVFKNAPKNVQEKSKASFQNSFKKYVKAMLTRRKNIFSEHSDYLGRAFVILT
jgi:hypothetical protein